MSAPDPARGVIDTGTFILTGRMTDPTVLPAEPLITTVTLAELSIGPHLVDDPSVKATRQAHLQLAESGFEPLPFDVAAAREFASVATDMRRTGRKASARSFDALIAATAMSRNLPLYTCNPSDYDGIDGLDLRTVPHPDAS